MPRCGTVGPGTGTSPPLAGSRLGEQLDGPFSGTVTIVSILVARDQLQPIEPSAYRGLLMDGEVVSRKVLHVWLAACGVVGAVVMGFALHESRHGIAAMPLIQAGAQIAVMATILQIPSGFYVILRMPESARDALLGSDGVATALFLASLFLAFVLIHALAGIALGDCDAGQVRAIGILLLVVMLMAASRHRVSHPLPSAIAARRSRPGQLDRGGASRGPSCLQVTHAA